MRVLTILFAAIAALVPACGSADPTQTRTTPTTRTATTTMPTVTVTARAPAAETKPASDPDEIVCLVTPPRTGSRIGGSRECHTRRDWDRQRKDSQTMLSDIQMHGMQGPTMSMDTRQMGH